MGLRRMVLPRRIVAARSRGIFVASLSFCRNYAECTADCAAEAGAISCGRSGPIADRFSERAAALGVD